MNSRVLPACKLYLVRPHLLALNLSIFYSKEPLLRICTKYKSCRQGKYPSPLDFRAKKSTFFAFVSCIFSYSILHINFSKHVCTKPPIKQSIRSPSHEFTCSRKILDGSVELRKFHLCLHLSLTRLQSAILLSKP
jgi:hypothetical protein